MSETSTIRRPITSTVGSGKRWRAIKSPAAWSGLAGSGSARNSGEYRACAGVTRRRSEGAEVDCMVLASLGKTAARNASAQKSRRAQRAAARDRDLEIYWFTLRWSQRNRPPARWRGEVGRWRQWPRELQAAARRGAAPSRRPRRVQKRHKPRARYARARSVSASDERGPSTARLGPVERIAIGPSRRGRGVESLGAPNKTQPPLVQPHRPDRRRAAKTWRKSPSPSTRRRWRQFPGPWNANAAANPHAHGCRTRSCKCGHSDFVARRKHVFIIFFSVSNATKIRRYFQSSVKFF